MAVVRPNKAHVLVVSDERNGSSPTLENRLLEEGYAVDRVGAAEVLERLADVSPDALIIHLELLGVEPLQLIKHARERDDTLPILAVGAADTLSAGDVMTAGAEECLTKPLDARTFLLLLERALERRAVRMENENLHRQLRERAAQGLEGLIGASPAMQRVYRVARQVAKSRVPVLVMGEPGTGKAELARTIHALSARASEPFVSVRCSGYTPSRLEDELFGAASTTQGVFERAHGGTLFLGNVEQIPLSIQVKLFRVLRERAIRRRGQRELTPFDVRIVASTSRDLADEVRKRRFRGDLYYRLNVVQLEMPPLRNRGADVLVLADHFLRRTALQVHKPLEGFTDAARSKIVAHSWPGNVSALERAIEIAANASQGTLIDESDLPADVSADMLLGAVRIPGSTMAELERHAILKTLEATDGSTSKAAELLDVSVRMIQYRLNEYHLSAKDARLGRPPLR